jgi:hypothetical protein
MGIRKVKTHNPLERIIIAGMHASIWVLVAVTGVARWYEARKSRA